MLVKTKKLKNQLKEVLHEESQEPEQLNLLFQLIENLQNFNIVEAWAFAREALSIAQRQKDRSRIAEAHLAMADTSWKMSQMSLAIECYEAALNACLQLQDYERIARCYSGMGIVSAEIGELERALDFFDLAMQHIKSSSSSKLSAVVTSNIGQVYLKLQHYNEAMNCFENALTHYTIYKDEQGEANVLGGIAGVQVQTGDFDEALETIKRVKELRRSEVPEPGRRLAIALMNTGIILLRMGQFGNAKQELEQALDLMRSVHFSMYEPEVLKHLMHASIELDQMTEFNRYLRLYEEFRHEDIINEARERHKKFRDFQSAQIQSIEQMLG